MFLLPLALTIFCFPTASAERERFSGAAATAGAFGAASSFFFLGAFLAGLAPGSAFDVAALSPVSAETAPPAASSPVVGAGLLSGESVGAATDAGFSVFGSSGFASVGSFASAI